MLHTFVFNHFSIYLLLQSCSYSSYMSEAKFLCGGSGSPPRAPFFCAHWWRGGQDSWVKGHSRLNNPSYTNTSVPADLLSSTWQPKNFAIYSAHVIVVFSHKKGVRNAFEAFLLKTPLRSSGPWKTLRSERQKTVCMMTLCSHHAYWLLPGDSLLQTVHQRGN